MKVLLIGATGLVGGMVVDRLLERGHEVHGLVRRATGRSGSGWHEHVAPALDWPGVVQEIGSADAAISCLGTTWRKAGSEAAFRAVDHDAVIAFARAARDAAVAHLLSVSSVGADANSRNFYLRTKGETDEALQALSFPRLDIFRPGLLLGERGSDRRPGERLGILLDPFTRLFLRGSWSRFAGMPASRVAAAIVRAVEQPGEGARVHENRDIDRLADQMLTSGQAPR
ncbi:NAD(P)H-binding protein [Sphingomonas sp.]|jgi:uncharacterized protein YbjT (DUF2867 family)|uniref:NAD(P)H-binding protein n=1 Tax=Sphingomonas sp. TaxID=28214 RepID=UPI002DE38537|nr:NAD(P)H-binding protein [Sphingomonas sp.]